MNRHPTLEANRLRASRLGASPSASGTVDAAARASTTYRPKADFAHDRPPSERARSPVERQDRCKIRTMPDSPEGKSVMYPNGLEVQAWPGVDNLGDGAADAPSWHLRRQALLRE